MPSVDDYLSKQPETTHAVLTLVRAAIRRALPKAEESISYGIPTYKLDGKPILYFAGWKKHVALYPVSAALLAKMKVDRAVEKGTIKFLLDERVPVGLVARIAKARAKEVTSAKKPPSAKARSRRK